MALDIEKCIKAALLPVAALVVLEIVYLLVKAASPLGFFLLVLADLLILAWAGYRVVKKQGMDFIGGTVTGVITGIVAGPVFMVVALIFPSSGLADAGWPGIAIAGVVLVAAITGAVLGAILGGVMGATGAFVAGKKK
jgi:hypothetical protein